ncbi:MAG TPA: hypothetical protein VJP87_08540 [Candidatus Acidoferrales bacterium]|nr:hypothetical protein [Candidatus Acidoferrales bacterium]
MNHVTSERSSHKTLLLLGFLGIAALSAWKLAGYIISGDMSGLSYAAILAIGGGIVIVILKDWRKGLYVFFAWLLFEDFVRKYLGNNIVIYFAKDALAAVLYLGFFLAYRRKQAASFRPPFLLPLLIFVWFGILQIFNPGSPHFAYGILGAKLFFYYMPLVFVGYALADSERAVRRFFFFNVGVIMVIALLGIAQSILGHTFLNPTNLDADIRDLATNYRISPVTGQISYRPTSIFVSTGRYADFLLVALLLVIGFSGYLLLRRQKGYNGMFLAIALVFGAILLAAARGTLLWGTGSALIFIAAFLWGAPWRQREIVRVLRTIQRAALGMVLGFVALMFLFPSELTARLDFYRETLAPKTGRSDLAVRAWDYPWRNFLGAFDTPRWPYGYGIGTSSLGTQYVTRIFGAKPVGMGVESGYGTMVIEIGVVGLGLWIIMCAAIVRSAWRVVRKLKGSPWFPLAFAIFWYAFLLLFPMTFNGMQPYEDFVLNAYVWLLLGILFRIPKLASAPQLPAPAMASSPAAFTGIR